MLPLPVFSFLFSFFLPFLELSSMLLFGNLLKPCEFCRAMMHRCIDDILSTQYKDEWYKLPLLSTKKSKVPATNYCQSNIPYNVQPYRLSSQSCWKAGSDAACRNIDKEHISCCHPTTQPWQREGRCLYGIGKKTM